MNLELPFKIHSPEQHSFEVVDGVGEIVASDLSYQDCEFIVKACNSHDALLVALKNIMEYLHDTDELGEMYLTSMAKNNYEKAVKAIALAERKQP